MFSEENQFIDEVVESDDSDEENTNSDWESLENEINNMEENNENNEQLMINIAYTQYPIVKEWAKLN